MERPIQRLGDGTEEDLLLVLGAHMPSNDSLQTGPGDDCAVVRTGGCVQLLKVDAVVEGRHFLRETSLCLVGRKALARALSDIAAMGGHPGHALVTLACGPERSLHDIEQIYEGIAELARTWDTSIAGGETVALPENSPLLLSISMTGTMPGKNSKVAPLLRSGGSPGDLLCVSGHLGGSFESGRHLTFAPRLREGQGLARFGAAAMMDLSDGLGTDLPRLARASGCGFILHEDTLPCHPGIAPAAAAGEGEDYELLFAISPDRLEALRREWPTFAGELPFTQIGHLTESEVIVPDWFGQGWDHFQNTSS